MLASICSELGGNSHTACPQLLQRCSPQPFLAAKIHSVPPPALCCCRSRLSPVTLLSSPPKGWRKASSLEEASSRTCCEHVRMHDAFISMRSSRQLLLATKSPSCLPGVEQAPHLWISAGSTAPCQGRGCCYLSSFSHYPKGWGFKASTSAPK